jgi:hyperosmotically inducible periplasmic protein
MSKAAVQTAAFLVASLALLAACQTTAPSPAPIDDTAITASIKAKLAADGDLNPFDIDVTTNAGVVTLQGRVKTEEIKFRAERVASGMNGVIRVIDLVKVGEQR